MTGTTWPDTDVHRPTLAEIETWPATVDLWRETGPNVAAVLGTSRATIYRMAYRGEIKTIRVGRRRVMPLTELKLLLGIAD